MSRSAHCFVAYLLPRPETFGNIQKINRAVSLTLAVFDQRRTWRIDVEMKAGRPDEVKMILWVEVSEAPIDEVRGDLIIKIQLFEENIRRSTLQCRRMPRYKVQSWIQWERIPCMR